MPGLAGKKFATRHTQAFNDKSVHWRGSPAVAEVTIPTFAHAALQCSAQLSTLGTHSACFFVVTAQTFYNHNK